VSLLDVHAGLQYQVIASHLGLDPAAKNMTNARCPYCGAHAWSIHQDNRTLEEWHYCSQCKVSGSVLAMAAERLELSEEETLDHFSIVLGLPIDAQSRKDFNTHLRFRRNFGQAWAEAQENMKYLKAEHHQYLRQLGWQRPPTMGLERFLEGPAQLYGMLSTQSANTYLHNLFSKRKAMMAVVPYFRTPTDIGSFACFPNHREVFLSSQAAGSSRYQTGDLGFAGLPLLEHSQSQHLVVTTMLSPMLMLHMHNYNFSQIPLPLLAARVGFTTAKERQWDTFGNRHVVLWEREPTPHILHQAIMLNAKLTFLGPNTCRQLPKETAGTRWWRWVHDKPAPDLITRLLNDATPYEKALKNWARTATLTEQVELAERSSKYSYEVYDLVHRCLRYDITARYGRRIVVPYWDPKRDAHRDVQSCRGHSVLIERDGKWFGHAGQVRLSGILRVSHVVVRRDGREYVGHLESNGKRVEFQVPMKQASWAWLRNFALSNGILLQNDTHVKPKPGSCRDTFCPFDAACRFHAPELVMGLESVGWDGGGFQFRRSRLVDGHFIPIPDFTFLPDVPGPQQILTRLTEERCGSLTGDNAEMEATWALAAAIAAQVTSPVVGLPTYGVWVYRESVDPGLRMLYNRLNIQEGNYRDWPHRWPRRLDNVANLRYYESTGFFVTSSPRLKNKKTREIIAVDLENHELQPRLISTSAEKILLHYLRHFTQLPRPEATDWPSWLEFTTQQFRELFTFAPPKLLEAALQRISLR
jgi:hypothetical protein